MAGFFWSQFLKNWRLLTATVGLRYISIFIQFAVIVLLSRRVEIEIQGVYLATLGLVATTRVLTGAGIPMGIVRELPALLASGSTARIQPTVATANWGSLTLSSIFAVVAILAAMSLGVEARIAIYAAIWWGCYATTYHCAQCLLALGEREAGSFYYFTGPPVALLLSLVPYLLLADSFSVAGLLLSTIAGALPLALTAVVQMSRALRRGNWPRGPIDINLLRTMIAFGAVNTISGFAIGAIYWMPTWLAGLTLGPAAAGIMGLSCRLYNVIVALLGAMRFVVRPQIVAAAVEHRWEAIERNARLIGTMTTANALLCLALHLLVGRWLIEAVFGAQYAAVFPVFAVLLLGAIAEAFGGVVDEVLKMTGAATFVACLLISGLMVEFVLGFYLQSLHGMMGLAWTQTIVLIAIYFFEIGYARSRRGVLIVPFVTPSGLISALRRRDGSGA
jgi:O-antigen/teichoic acid export membrane protein